MVVNMLTVYRGMGVGQRKTKQLGPIEYIAHLCGANKDTVSGWEKECIGNGEPLPERRGGDRRSLEWKDDQSANQLHDAIVDYIDDRHRNRIGVVLELLLEHLHDHHEFIEHMPSVGALQRFMSRNGFTWERVNKYEGLKESDYVKQRKYHFIRAYLLNS